MDENDARIEIIDALLAEAEGMIGVDATQEVRENSDFFEGLIPMEALTQTTALSLAIMRPNADEDEIESCFRMSLGCVLWGMECYRQFLMDRGYDMLKLEGRK